MSSSAAWLLDVLRHRKPQEEDLYVPFRVPWAFCGLFFSPVMKNEQKLTLRLDFDCAVVQEGVIKETRDMLHIVYHMKELQKKGTMKASGHSKVPCGCSVFSVRCGAPTCEGGWSSPQVSPGCNTT